MLGDLLRHGTALALDDKVAQIAYGPQHIRSSLELQFRPLRLEAQERSNFLHGRLEFIRVVRQESQVVEDTVQPHKQVGLLAGVGFEGPHDVVGLMHVLGIELLVVQPIDRFREASIQQQRPLEYLLCSHGVGELHVLGQLPLEPAHDARRLACSDLVDDPLQRVLRLRIVANAGVVERHALCNGRGPDRAGRRVADVGHRFSRHLLPVRPLLQAHLDRAVEFIHTTAKLLRNLEGLLELGAGGR